MTINIINYSQPSFYRFSDDSIWLAHTIAHKINGHCNSQTMRSLKVLDLCAGCGVVGIEFLSQINQLNSFQQITFLELQADFKTHIEDNWQQFAVKSNAIFLNINIEITSLGNKMKSSSISSEEKFDIILSNPPYFAKGTGIPSPNSYKNRCHFFDVDDLELFENFIAKNLKPSGRGFFVGPSLMAERLLRAQTIETKVNRSIFELKSDS